MTKEDKQLLLKDLAARLPYNVHIFTNSKHHIRLLTISRDLDYDEQYWINGLYDIDEVKPYLRPMSSMTKEEYKEFNDQIYKAKPYSDGKSYNVYEVTGLNVDWLNAHHFDYRGLIEKGLAIEAPKGMYN